MSAIKKLPSGYVAIDYLTSRGNHYSCAYLATGVNTGLDIAMDIRMRVNDLTAYLSSCGATYSSNQGWLTCGIRADSGLVSLFASGTRAGASIPADTNWHNFYVSNGLQKIDNTITTNTISSIPNSLPIQLFMQNVSYSASGNVDISIGYAKIYKNNVLIRDYIPCIRKSDRVYGMYDLVNGTFVTASQGQFTY